MTEPSLLPPRRELTAPTADRIRSRVHAGMSAPAPTRSRWLPLAAAAAVIALVAGAVAVAGARDDQPVSPAVTPSPTGPDLAAMLTDCLEVSRADEISHQLGNTAPFWVRALWQDRYGYLLLISNERMAGECAFDLDGTAMPAGSSGTTSGYLDRPGEAVEVRTYGTHHVTPRNDRLGYDVEGRVSRGVARVEVTWPGAEPVTAALEGPDFVARATFPGVVDVDRPATIVAYDAAGNELGRTSTAR